MSVFDGYAAYYDLLYRDKDYAAEASYVLGALGPGITDILELGCGTGAHAALWAAQGKRVHGVDLSPTMLERARQRKVAQGVAPTFEQGDARSVRTGRIYDAVLSLFHVLSYQTTDSDARAMLATAAAHLPVGGKLLFDFWYAPAVLSQLPEVRVKRLEDETVRILRVAEPTHLPKENVVLVDYEVWVENKRSAERQRLNERHPMRYFSIPEVQALLADVGLRFERAEEWLTGQPLSASTWGACVLATKTEAR